MGMACFYSASACCFCMTCSAARGLSRDPLAGQLHVCVYLLLLCMCEGSCSTVLQVVLPSV